MSRRPGPSVGAGERGFVLIGVVMFVLALTILGLSLYGLSGFEAGFLQDSIDREQAFYDASGGIQRALWILAQQGTLASVKNGIPDGNGVVYTKAWITGNPDDSTRAISWADTTRISVRVLAVRGVGGRVRRMVQCTFTPYELKSVYANLFTAGGPSPTSGQVQVQTHVPPGDKPTLWGRVWQNDPGTGWTGAVSASMPVTFTVGGAPLADLLDYRSGLEARYAGIWSHAVRYLPHPHRYLLTAGGSRPLGADVRFFFTPHMSGPTDFTVDNQDDGVTLNLGGGTAIWLIERGLRFARPVTISGDPGSMLVIVAGASSQPGPLPGMRNVGAAFDSLGVDPNVAVIVVSDGSVAFHRSPPPPGPPPGPATLPWLSVFASDVVLDSPHQSGGWTLLHDPTVDPPTLQYLIDNQLLPNTDPGQNRHLEQVAGTWTEVLTTNPDDSN